jgi:mitofilin
MNVAKDLSAATLLAEALKSIGDALTDDEKAAVERGMKIQSEHDVKVFTNLSSNMIENFERVVGVERSATDELVAAIHVLESRTEEAKRQIDLVRTRAEVDKAQALTSQETTLKAQHADFLVGERTERIRVLDEERARMGALRTVLTKRREALERAHAVQSFELAMMDLGSRLDNGEAFDETLALLRVCAQSDPFIASIIDGIDTTVATKGVLTRAQLAEQLERVRQTARALALVPQEGGGMFAHGLAYAASLLRMKDTSEEGAQGIEGAIARAETFLADGSLMLAARALEEASTGTKASTTVSEWSRNVKHRAVMEQAQTALRAHAQCRASALV